MKNKREWTSLKGPTIAEERRHSQNARPWFASADFLLVCRDKTHKGEVKKQQHIHHNLHECYALKLSFPFFHEISRTMIRDVGFLAKIRS
jgi:hypothetical protein